MFLSSLLGKGDVGQTNLVCGTMESAWMSEVYIRMCKSLVNLYYFTNYCFFKDGLTSVFMLSFGLYAKVIWWAQTNQYIKRAALTISAILMFYLINRILCTPPFFPKLSTSSSTWQGLSQKNNTFSNMYVMSLEETCSEMVCSWDFIISWASSTCRFFFEGADGSGHVPVDPNNVMLTHFSDIFYIHTHILYETHKISHMSALNSFKY